MTTIAQDRIVRATDRRPSTPAAPAKADRIEAVTEKIEVLDRLSIGKEAAIFTLNAAGSLSRARGLTVAASVLNGESQAVSLMAQAGGRAASALGAFGSALTFLGKIAPIIGLVTTISDVVEFSRAKDPDEKATALGHTLMCATNTIFAFAALAFPPAALALGLTAGAISLVQLIDMYAADERLERGIGKALLGLFGKGKTQTASA